MPSNEIAEAWDESGWDAQLDEITDKRVPVTRVPWDYPVQTIEDATFIIAAKLQAKVAIASMRAQTEAKIAVMERYCDSLDSRYQLPIEHIVKRELAGGTKKSMSLVTGVGSVPTKVGFRSVKGTLKVVNAASAVAWAKECEWGEGTPPFVKTEEVIKPIAATFKAHFKATGEVPPGTEITEDEERFFVR